MSTSACASSRSRTLRERFPEVTLVIGTLANGSNVWYLPDANSFGNGLYQEEDWQDVGVSEQAFSVLRTTERGEMYYHQIRTYSMR